MTRVKVSASELRRLIDAHDPTWLKKARKQTKALEAGVANPEFPKLWSKIKAVYIRLQGGDRGGKCAYCEKWIEAVRIEHDIEHFRPKAKVARWKIPGHLVDEFRTAGLQVNQPAQGSEPGYRLLAYHPLNYAAVCKECNSVLKKNLFPITGKRRSDAKDPAKLAEEGALLIYPIGRIDADPEDLIEFQGVSPRPRAVSGIDRLRALVTIDIFQLDGWRRKSLIRDRALWIRILFSELTRRDRGTTANDAADAEQFIALITSTTYPHANCLRSFHRLYESSPAEAEKYYLEVKSYLESYSPS